MKNSQETKEQIFQLVLRYMDDHGITDSDQVFQNDEANLDAQYLVGEIIDLII